MAEPVTKFPSKQSAPAPASTRRAVPSLWQSFDTMREEMDRLFDSLARGTANLPLGRRLFDVEPLRHEAPDVAVPAIDVTENENAYQIAAELPGLTENDVEVVVADEILTIKGEKNEEKEQKDKNYYVAERRYGSFQRSFQLPSGVDADKITADFRNGVLTLILPKTPEAQKSEKKIAIKTK